jgi:RND family efflux transporter MFP subunit
MKFPEPDVSVTEQRADDHLQTISKTPPTPKPWLGLLIALLIIGGGATLWHSLNAATSRTPAASKSLPPRPVETVPLSAGTGVRNVQLLGQVEASTRAVIRTQTSGVVQQVLVQPGDRVKAGMTIVLLDDADQRLGLAEAQARLAQDRNNLARLEVGTRKEIIAQRRAAVQSAAAREQDAIDNLERIRELVIEGAFSERLLVEARAAVDDAKGERLAAAATLAEAEAGPTAEEIAAQRATVKAAQTAVYQAQLALKRTRVTATLDGIVQSRQASPGDYLETADEIATLINPNNLDIFLELPEDLSGGVSAGQAITLTTRALPQWQGQATITGVVPAAEAASRRQRVRVRLDNPPAGLLAGMAIAGNLALPANKPSFVVSRDALTRRQDQWLVFTVTNGKAQSLAVQIVADMGERVAIYGDRLRAGQPIVLTGGDGLKNGAAVKVMERKS